MLVVDSSVLISSLLPDEDGPDLATLFAGHDDLAAPALLAAEVRNILLHVERRGRLDEATSDARLDAVDDLGIVLDQVPAGPRAVRLARRHGLSTYDAMYLELALRHGATLATFDSALRRAAKAEGVLENG